MEALVALSGEREIELATLAIAGLRHLSLSDQLKRVIVDSGALRYAVPYILGTLFSVVTAPSSECTLYFTRSGD